MKGLPPDSLVRTPITERGREPWTAYHELLSQLIEVTSVAASGRQLRKPMQVPRPKKAQPAAAHADELEIKAPAGVNPYRAAIAALGGKQPSRLRAQLAGGEKERTA